MPRYTINYDVRFYNGCMTVEADNREEAEEKFHQLPEEAQIESTNNVEAEIESIEEEK